MNVAGKDSRKEIKNFNLSLSLENPTLSVTKHIANKCMKIK